jgi:RNA polymerase sigma-70 factor (ECF subfamily)
MALDQALEGLPEKTRQVFKMSRYEYLSHREIAQQLQLTEKAVKYHITHLRTYLRDFLVVLLLGCWKKTFWVNILLPIG